MTSRVWEGNALRVACIIPIWDVALHFPWRPWAPYWDASSWQSIFLARRRMSRSALLLPCLEHSTAFISPLKSLRWTPSHKSAESIAKHIGTWARRPHGGGEGTHGLLSLVAFLLTLFWSLQWRLYIYSSSIAETAVEESLKWRVMRILAEFKINNAKDS